MLGDEIRSKQEIGKLLVEDEAKLREYSPRTIKNHLSLVWTGYQNWQGQFNGFDTRVFRQSV